METALHSLRFSLAQWFIQTNPTYLRKLFTLFILLSLLRSCKKDKEILSAISLSGSVKDSLTLAGIANVRIRTYWYNQGDLKETDVIYTTTDDQGNYTIKAIIDKANFNSKVLNVVAIVPNSYIAPVDVGHREAGMRIHGIQSD